MYRGARTWRRHAEKCFVIRVANEQHTQAYTVARQNNRNGHTDSLTARPKPQSMFFSWWRNLGGNLFNYQLIQTRMNLLKIRVMYPLYYSWLSPSFPLLPLLFSIHVYSCIHQCVLLCIDLHVCKYITWWHQPVGAQQQQTQESRREEALSQPNTCWPNVPPWCRRWIPHLPCYMTQSYVWHDSLYYVTWRNHTGHASFNFPVPPWCLMRKPHSYVVSSYVWNYSVMCVVESDMTRLHERHDWIICMMWLYICVTWLISLCDMPHL